MHVIPHTSSEGEGFLYFGTQSEFVCRFEAVQSRSLEKPGKIEIVDKSFFHFIECYLNEP